MLFATSWVMMFCWVLLHVALNPAVVVASDELPPLREGLWEYQRTLQRSDENWTPKDTVVRECGNPTTVLEQHSAVYRKLGCAIVSIRVTEATYQVNADCPSKNGIKTESRGVTTFDGDSAYTSVIDSEGSVAGKPVKFVEKLSAKRIGDCEKK